jgi:hypothetical protein
MERAAGVALSPASGRYSHRGRSFPEGAANVIGKRRLRHSIPSSRKSTRKGLVRDSGLPTSHYRSTETDRFHHTIIDRWTHGWMCRIKGLNLSANRLASGDRCASLGSSVLELSRAWATLSRTGDSFAPYTDGRMG